MAPPTPISASRSEFSALLDLERVLAGRLEAAHREAGGLIEAARFAAAQREAGLAAQLERAAHELEVRLSTERDRRISEVTDAARERMERFDALATTQIEQAAAAVIGALVGTTMGGKRK